MIPTTLPSLHGADRATVTTVPMTGHLAQWSGVAVAVLLLAALTLAAQGVIERRVHAAVRTALDAAGDGWVTVAVSGQSATLGGREPQPGRAGAALHRVHALTCPTWTGPRPCVARVEADFVAAAEGPSRSGTGAAGGSMR